MTSVERTKNRQQNVCIRFHVPAVRRPTLVRQEGNLGSGYKNTDLKWSRKRIELSPEVIVQVHRLNLIDRHSQTTQSDVFIATPAAIYSLEHGLCTFTAVLRSTQPSTRRGTVKGVSACGLSNNKNGDDGCG